MATGPLLVLLTYQYSVEDCSIVPISPVRALIELAPILIVLALARPATAVIIVLLGRHPVHERAT